MANKKIKLSVVLATRNEEANIGRCLNAVKNIADEVIIFDEYSTDKTADIARKLGAKIYLTKHQDNFHITKQKAIDKARGEWILQLDADEVVSPELAKEIKEVVSSTNKDLLSFVISPATIHNTPSAKKTSLFLRHQQLIEKRDGKLGNNNGVVVAFFLPRVNIFLGKPLMHAGVYPDGVIRLIKRGFARLPAKDIHEQMEIDGEVGWLYGDLWHYDSPTMDRYIWRMNRYTDLLALDFSDKKLPKNLWYFLLYTIYYPLITFISLFVRHKGFVDGARGFLWSFFSAFRFPMAYWKYWIS